jgi:hypothetical protein
MDRFKLPNSTEINGKAVPFDADYRNALKIFEIFNDPDLLEVEKIGLALENFYTSEEYMADVDTAISEMMFFLRGGTDEEPQHNVSSAPLYDWEKDFDIICAPINRVMSVDVRGLEFLHWWTFLSAFMEIGECTFNTYVSIRDKLNRGKKLESWEERIYKEHRNKITF